ncbi:kelch domain-containing protein 3-like [Toxorhynchites rutilus septentrionalis]|uniref:kelch domain-containing protein 3-like n=1 Tax=Toxorhynchites rutilus septentrionalis TaxID=329112 RepID=UPI002478C16A|nr:kelch domain-containing protein 3-like [Toxorhynchites rutilus septentrionalis]
MFQWADEFDSGPNQITIPADSVGDIIYVVEGEMTGERSLMQVCVLNTRNMQWTIAVPNEKGSRAPSYRYGHSAVAYGHCIYVWGGGTVPKNTRNELYCFNTVTSTWRLIDMETQPANRYHHSACLYGKRMYIFGGFCVFNDEKCNDVHYLDLETHRWHRARTTGYHPDVSHYDSVVVINHKIFSFGMSGIAYLDLKKNRWHYVQNKFRYIGYNNCFSYRNKLYILFDDKSACGCFRNIAKCLDPETLKWKDVQILGPLQDTRFGHRCVVIGERLFIYGGLRFRGSGRTSLPHGGGTLVLILSKSLKTLAIQAIIENKLDVSSLPKPIQVMLNTVKMEQTECSVCLSSTQNNPNDN